MLPEATDNRSESPPHPLHGLGENLIFIISQPRSGSTLLQRVLAGHPDIQTAAETWLMLHPIYGLRKDGIQAEFNSPWAQKGVDDFIRYYATDSAIAIKGIRAWANTIYCDVLAKNNKRFFLDKTPRYFFIIPELYRVFPNAKYIFLLRHPAAVLASELNTYVKGDWPVLSLFRPDLLDAPRLILEGIDLLGERGHTIHYEDFVAHPQAELSSLCSWIGIDYDQNMLNYANTPKPKGVMNDPVGIDRHNKPDPSSAFKWKALAEDPQSCYFATSYLNALGQDILDRMGYSFTEADSLFGSCSGTSRNCFELFPWELAIKDKQFWTIRDHYCAEKYFLSRKTTRRHARYRASKRLFKRLYRILYKQLYDGS